jgi:hypothetical protein
MNETTQQAGLSSHARATGVVYLSYFATTILGVLLSSRKVPAGIVLNGLADVLYATMTILLYRIFQPAQPLLALAATLCSLAGCVTDGLHTLKWGHRWGFADLSPLVFFGPFCVLLGMLILRSRFLPRWLGWPLIVAGLGWLAYLNPVVAQHAQIVIFLVGFLAEFVLMLWLLLRGVDEARWRERKSSS